MHQYQINIAFHHTKLSAFSKAIQAISSTGHKQFFKELKDYFKADQNWQTSDASEFNIRKLLDSSLFKDEADPNSINWKALSLFAVYTCKVSNKNYEYRKA